MLPSCFSLTSERGQKDCLAAVDLKFDQVFWLTKGGRIQIA
jgi:hypothetical protein